MIERLVYMRRWRVVREVLLLVANLDVPKEVVIEEGLILHHRGMGTVIHPRTRIGKNVTIYHQVTVGRKDAHIPAHETPMKSIVIEDDVVLYPGSKVLAGPGVTRIGRGCIIAANSVLMRSTGDYEIWGGIPAKLLATRAQS